MVNIVTFFKKLLPTLTVVLLVWLVLPQAVFASSLFLSPAKKTVAVGETVSTQVKLNTGGDSVNAVSAFISYPADKLEVAWISYPSSAFPIAAEGSFGGGVIKISRGSLNPVSGNVGVATVGFRGKAAGSATVAFIGGSAAPRASDSSDSLNLGSSSGTVFQVGGTVAPKAKPTTKPSQNQPQGTELIVSDITISSVTTDGAEVTWKTNSKADSYIEFGLDKDVYIFNVSDPRLVTDHLLKLTDPMLLPGVTIHFRIKSRDTDGNLGVSPDQAFQLLGYTLRLKITDGQGEPVENTEVWLYSDPVKGTTDKNGEVIFPNVTVGKHKVVIKYSGVDKTGEVVVADAPSPQEFTLNAESLPAASQAEQKSAEKSSLPKIDSKLFLLIGVIVMLAIVVAFILIRKRRDGGTIKKGPDSAPPPPPTMMTPMDPSSQV